MNTRKIAWWLIAIGAGLNIIDAFSAKDTSGGIVFGTNGFLKGIDASIPHAKLAGIDINSAGWVLIIGLVMLAWAEWS